ncbi:hypothetical protein FTV88_0291 [Heliorestis convoluta]|uniref:Flagellar protein n=1 Tax=Heliorestis convoluta TaxID=356322 RepID=A0A5Q2N2A3_9FIRM|nr:hypothetical protein FTV88_0291 [Heliorestis convoluta]
MNVKNCASCHTLFFNPIRSQILCPQCKEDEEINLGKVHTFLNNHQDASLLDVVMETGISESQIRRYIEEGRIDTTSFTGLELNCQICGLPIKTGNRCSRCSDELKKEFQIAYLNLSRKDSNNKL